MRIHAKRHMAALAIVAAGIGAPAAGAQTTAGVDLGIAQVGLGDTVTLNTGIVNVDNGIAVDAGVASATALSSGELANVQAAGLATVSTTDGVQVAGLASLSTAGGINLRAAGINLAALAGQGVNVGALGLGAAAREGDVAIVRRGVAARWTWARCVRNVRVALGVGRVAADARTSADRLVVAVCQRVRALRLARR